MRAKFILTEVLSGLRRNITMTIAMIITTAISIGLLGSGLAVVQMSDKTEQIYLDRVEIELYLTDDISINDPLCEDTVCSTLSTELENTEGVQAVTYISQDKARDMFQEMFVNDPELVSIVESEGLRLPASFRLHVTDPDLFDTIEADFADRPGVMSVRTEKELVDKLLSVLGAVRNGAFIVAVIQGVGAILLIANMIQIAAYSRRTEVGIMRLVGASRWYTQLPFLLEAVVAAVIGSLLAIGGLFIANGFFVQPVLGDVYRANIIGKITAADLGVISPILVLISAALAAITAWVTLRLYVRE